MLYSLCVLEAMGIENDNKSSSNKDNQSDGSDLEANTKADLQYIVAKG